jgi:hypothetical protein
MKLPYLDERWPRDNMRNRYHACCTDISTSLSRAFRCTSLASPSCCSSLALALPERFVSSAINMGEAYLEKI